MKYIVQPWETWETIDTIASRFGVSENDMMKANPVLYSVPVYPGMILEIPGHDIIAHRFKLDYQRVVAQNPQIKNPNVIWPGQILYLIFLGY